MAYEILMPQLGLTMEEGTVSQWIKHEGDAVKAGDVVAEITTDKPVSYTHLGRYLPKLGWELIRFLQASEKPYLKYWEEKHASGRRQ